MLKFSFHATNLVNEVSFNKTVEKLTPYIEELKEKRKKKEYNIPETSILLPEDTSVLEESRELVEKLSQNNPAAVVVIGIGGSNLGAMATYKALKHTNLERPIYFIETLDPIHYQEVLREVENIYQNNQHVITILISKSGSTTETIANYGAFITDWQSLDNNWKKHLLVITSEYSNLWKYAQDSELLLHKHESVGGRYSIMSSVGLIPLGLAGVDIDALLEGAETGLERCLFNDPDHNPALSSAISIYLNTPYSLSHAGALHSSQVIANRTIHNIMVFTPQLLAWGLWYRQLIGESLGKQELGITPIASNGLADLHSVVQLLLGGADDKFTTFISSPVPSDYFVSSEKNLNSVVENIEGLSFSQINNAILGGVKTAFQKQRLPFVEIELEGISPESLGELFQVKMIETMFLAKLMRVDAFNQPEVELYKIETRRILGSDSIQN